MNSILVESGAKTEPGVNTVTDHRATPALRLNDGVKFGGGVFLPVTTHSHFFQFCRTDVSVPNMLFSPGKFFFSYR